MFKRKIVIANCPQLEYSKCNYHKDIFGNKLYCSDIVCDVKVAIKKHSEKLSKIYKEMENK